MTVYLIFLFKYNAVIWKYTLTKSVKVTLIISIHFNDGILKRIVKMWNILGKTVYSTFIASMNEVKVYFMLFPQVYLKKMQIVNKYFVKSSKYFVLQLVEGVFILFYFESTLCENCIFFQKFPSDLIQRLTRKFFQHFTKFPVKLIDCIRNFSFHFTMKHLESTITRLFCIQVKT